MVGHSGHVEKEVWWEPLRVVIDTSEEKSWNGLSSQETLQGVHQQLQEEQGPLPKRRSKKMSAMQVGSLAIVISKETWTRKKEV